MNTQGAKPAGTRDQPEMPGYFGMNRKGRDEFLSQIGHFSEEQRTLFSLLCDMWEPDIPYAKFITKARHGHMNAEPTLNALMNQMEREKCGLISCSVKENRLEKTRIILTERDSLRFWYWKVENAWQRIQVDDREPFPSLAAFQERTSFPSGSLQPLSLTDISESFVRRLYSQVQLCTLSDVSDSAFIITPASIPVMVRAARSKVRSVLANSSFLPVLSRLLGTVVSDLRRCLLKNDHSFWNRLTGVIGGRKEDLRAKTPNLSGELFIAAKILSAYTRNELSEAGRRKENDAEKRDVMKNILANLAGYEGFLIPKEDLQAQFEPYKDRWPDINETFASHFMSETGSNTLPVVLSIGGKYIHRDQIYPLFKMHYEQAASELHEFYLNLIELILIGKAGNRGSIFADAEAFRNDIQDRLSTDFEVLDHLLTIPSTISEGIIHYAGKVLRIQDMQRIKGVLQRYFDGAALQFKELERLFRLNPRAMFDEAFGRLGGFRRLILKSFGRYASCLQLFNRALSPRRAQRRSSAPPEHRSRFSEADTEHTKAARSERPERSGPVPAERGKITKTKRNPPSGYTSRQRNAAWNEFRDAYKRTKNDKN